MRKYSLKVQFVISFVCILIFSLLATAMTYLFAYYLYGNVFVKLVRPSNYFESKIPYVRNYIKKKGSKILEKGEEKNLKKAISAYGVSYEVMDKNADIIYGNDNERIIKNAAQLYDEINVTSNFKGDFQKYSEVIPVVSKGRDISGGVLIIYKVTPTYENSGIRLLSTIFIAAVILSPFIYIIIFTIIFSKLLTASINRPLKMLIKASHNIKEKNLDFNIDYNGNNEMGQLCSAFNDMKAELQKSLVSQWRMEQEKLDMVESLVHDMKTPLSIVNGYVELIEGGNARDEEKLKKYIGAIKKNIDRSFNFIKKIQYNEQNGNLTSNIKLTCIDIITFVKKKFENYKIMSGEKNVSINLNIDNEREFEKPVFINVQDIERIIDNIMANSFRYTPEKGTIDINVRIDNEKVYFSIWNSGPPFNSEEIPNLLKKMYRGKSSLKEDNHAGLGLYIVSELTKKNGGTVSAFNPEKGGACISFSIKCN